MTGSIFDVILPITNENNFYYSNVTYKKLLTLKELHAIKYADLLQCLEWKIKRFEILLRDNNTCQKCLKTITIKVETSTNQKTYLVELNNQNASSEEHLNLHVHHKLYIFNRLPWNYDSKYLITLCNSCHETVHLNKVIPVYNEKGIKIDEFGKCNRCNGIGYLPV